MGWLIASVGPGELMAIGSSFTFAASQAFIRQGMRSATPLAAALAINLSVALGGLILSLWDGTLLASTLPPLLWYAAVGVIGPGLGRITAYIGMVRMGMSRSTTISSATPIWGTLAAIAILGEAPGAMVLLGTLGIVGGVVLLSLRGEKSERFGSWFRGALIYPLICSVAYALPPVFAKLAYAHQATPAVGMAVSFTVGNIVLLAGRRLIPGRGRISADARAWPWLALAGAAGVASSLLLWTAFTLASVSTALPLSRIAPVWVLLISYLFMGRLERITRRDAAATLLVVAGGVLITAFRG